MKISEHDGQTVVVRNRGDLQDVYFLYMMVDREIYFLSPKQENEPSSQGKVEKAILPNHLYIDGSGVYIKLLPKMPKQ